MVNWPACRILSDSKKTLNSIKQFGGVMNYAYLPVPGGIQNLQPPFVPQGAIGAQLGQFTGGIGGPLLPGPFGGFASQLLPQLGNVLPFQAVPQQQMSPQV